MPATASALGANVSFDGLAEDFSSGLESTTGFRSGVLPDRMAGKD